MAKGLVSIGPSICLPNDVFYQRDYHNVRALAIRNIPISDPLSWRAQWREENDIDYLNHRRFWDFKYMLRRVNEKGYLERADRIIDRKVSVHVNWLINSNGTNKFHIMTRRGAYEVAAYTARCLKAELVENILHCVPSWSRTRPKILATDKKGFRLADLRCKNLARYVLRNVE